MTIDGVRVCCTGLARGHDLVSDDITLAQLESELRRRGRTPVKLNHGGKLESVVGFLENPRQKGGKLLADLSLLKSSSLYEFAKDLIARFGTAIGLSAAFSGTAAPLPDGQKAARCSELHSVDLVETPALGNGLFEAEFNGALIAFQSRAAVVTLTAKQSAELRQLRRRVTALQIRFDKRNRRGSLPNDEEEEPRASVTAHAATGALEGAAGIYGVEPLLDKYLHGKAWKNPFKDSLLGHGKKIAIGATVGAAATAPIGALVERYRKAQAERGSKMSAGAEAAIDDMVARKRKEQEENRFSRLTPEEERDRSLYRVSDFRHRVAQKEIDQAASSYLKSAVVGAGAGAAVGSLRGRGKVGAAIGSLASVGSLAGLRAALPPDDYGQRSPAEHQIEKAVPLTAAAIAAIAARKKLKQTLGKAAQKAGNLFA